MSRNAIIRTAQLAAVLTIFTFLAWRLDIDSLLDAIAEIDAATAIAVVALNLVTASLFGLRSHVALRRLGHDLPFDLVLAAAVVGNVAGALTPASSGELLRAVALKSHANVSYKDGAALVVFERGLSLYMLVLGTLVGIAVYAATPPLAIAAVLAGVAALALPCVCARFLNIIPVPSPEGSGWQHRIHSYVADIAVQLQHLFGHVPTMLVWMGITAAGFGVVTLQFWMLAHALEDTITPLEAWIAFGGSQLAALVSLIPLGLGASDASLAAILDRFGMTLEHGAAVAVLVRATATLPLIILAAASWLYLARRTPIAQVHEEASHATAVPAQDT